MIIMMLIIIDIRIGSKHSDPTNTLVRSWGTCYSTDESFPSSIQKVFWHSDLSKFASLTVDTWPASASAQDGLGGGHSGHRSSMHPRI